MQWNGRRCAVAMTQNARRVGWFGVVTAEELFDPSLAERGRLRRCRNIVVTRQNPESQKILPLRLLNGAEDYEEGAVMLRTHDPNVSFQF
jgi:hypothetical protein